MRPSDNIEKLIKKLRYKTSAETHDKVLGNVLQALDEKEKVGATTPDTWRIIMKSPITKIAIAAVIIITAVIFLNPFETTVTFADVIQPILNARTASLDIVIGSQGNQPVIHDDVMGSRIRRIFPNMQTPDIIIDLEQQKSHQENGDLHRIGRYFRLEKLRRGPAKHNHQASEHARLPG